MFAREILTRLLEKTKERYMTWQVSTPRPNMARYKARYELLELEISSTILGGTYEAPGYEFTLKITEDGRILLRDSGVWSNNGPNEEDADMMNSLISLIREQQQKEQEAEDKLARERTINYILKIIS